MDDHGVGGLERGVLFFQRPLQIIHCDLVAVAKHLDVLVASDIDQHAARDNDGSVLNAQSGETRACRDLISFETVVVTVSVALMREAVELRAQQISSLLPRSFDCGFMNVRFKWMSKRRVPENSRSIHPFAKTYIGKTFLRPNLG
jgi:hypothetical protein